MTSMTSTMRTFENHLPRRVITGRGTSEELLPICQAHGWRRVFLASDAGVEAAGLTGRVARPLEAAGLLADTFSAVPPEPRSSMSSRRGSSRPSPTLCSPSGAGA
jgi:alcohol dehydrogenase class IV